MILWLMIAMLVMTACSSGAPSDVPVAEEQAAPAGDLTTGEEAEITADEAAMATVEPVSQSDTSAANAITFQIVPEGTEARFSIYELLMGQDKTVIGVTSLVEGAITVDPTSPQGASISPIRIDARDLRTDSERRNGAIRRFVLQSNQDQYQYILFTPTALEGLPEEVAVGDSFSFTIVGDLKIRDITNQETFEVTVTANSESELVGLATTTIARGDYNLTIPSVPSVANVAEEMPLELEFTAIAD